jgi:hypothetical protein
MGKSTFLIDEQKDTEGKEKVSRKKKTHGQVREIIF